MHNHFIKSPLRALLIVVLVCAGLFLLSACEEMPELASDVVSDNAELTGGPYILLDSSTSPEIIRFRTNIPCVAGIRSSRQQKMTQRYGANQTNHALDLSKILPSGGEETLQLLLDDVDSVKLRLSQTKPGDPVTLGFLGGGAGDSTALGDTARRLAAQTANAVVLTGGSYPPAKSKITQWDAQFFNPMRPLSEVSPFFMLPETRLILPSEAAPTPKTPYWSHDRGCVHLVFFDLDELKSPTSREALLAWLRQDLAAQTQPWCVVVLSQPLFGATRIHARAVETLGTILEVGGVDLVVSGGADYYFRSLPVKSGGSGVVRYITTGGLEASKNGGMGREYKAAAANVPHYAVLQATRDRLEWKVYPLSSVGVAATLDELSITSDGTSLQGEPAVEKMDILTDALSTLSLQREVLTIAREAARAVDNPAIAQEIPFIIANASPREVSGELVWEVSPAGAYTVEPAAIKYNLKSGYEGVVNFTVTPNAKIADAPMPQLVVNMKGVGSARQQLILTKGKQANLYPADGLQVDGNMNEPAWQSATELKDFGIIGNGGKPKQPIEAKVAYDSRGLYLIARCAAKDADTIATKAVNHDDPVHLDESVEFFLAPRHQAREYYQFAVNIKNVTLDRSSMHGLAWNPSWESAVVRSKDYYTVEVFIPWQALGLTGAPVPGSQWGLNISRNDYQATAVHENPFAPTAGAPGEAATDTSRVNRFNIGKLAEMDLGRNKPAPVHAQKTATGGQGAEIVQWADTFGSNARSGLYGTVQFEGSRAPVPAAGTPPPSASTADLATPAVAAESSPGETGYTPLPIVTGTKSGSVPVSAQPTTPAPAAEPVQDAPIPEIPSLPGN